MRMRCIFILVITLLFTACHGKRRSKGFFLDGIYKNEELKFFVGEIKKPWRRLSVETVNLAYYHPKNYGVIYLTGKCKGSSDAPLMVLRTHLLIGFKSKNYEQSKKIMLHGRKAIHSILTAKLDGVSRKIDYYIFKRNGCLFDLVLISPEKSFIENQHFFKQLVTHFKILKGSGIYIQEFL